MITHDVKSALISTVAKRQLKVLVAYHRINGIRTLSNHEIEGQDVECLGRNQILLRCSYSQDPASKFRA